MAGKAFSHTPVVTLDGKMLVARTYRIKIKVTAAGTSAYAKGSKTVTVKITVK